MSSSTFEYLEQLFPGQLLIPVIDAGHVLGMAKQTVRNKLSDGSFPVTTYFHHNRRVVKKGELAAHIDQIGKPGRGRPKKLVPLADEVSNARRG